MAFLDKSIKSSFNETPGSYNHRLDVKFDVTDGEMALKYWSQADSIILQRQQASQMDLQVFVCLV